MKPPCCESCRKRAGERRVGLTSILWLCDACWTTYQKVLRDNGRFVP